MINEVYSMDSPASYSLIYPELPSADNDTDDDENSLADATVVPESVGSYSATPSNNSLITYHSAIHDHPQHGLMIVEGVDGYTYGRVTCKRKKFPKDSIGILPQHPFIIDDNSVEAKHSAFHVISHTSLCEPNEVRVSAQTYVGIPPIHHDGPGAAMKEGTRTNSSAMNGLSSRSALFQRRCFTSGASCGPKRASFASCSRRKRVSAEPPTCCMPGLLLDVMAVVRANLYWPAS